MTKFIKFLGSIVISLVITIAIDLVIFKIMVPNQSYDGLSSTGQGFILLVILAVSLIIVFPILALVLYKFLNDKKIR